MNNFSDTIELLQCIMQSVAKVMTKSKPLPQNNTIDL